MIFYERSTLRSNPGLTEIKNKKFLDHIIKDFNSKYVQYNSMTPIIMGSIIHKAPHHGLFDRKLKMLKAPFFGLLQVS